jgi:hypothetical protein
VDPHCETMPLTEWETQPPLLAWKSGAFFDVVNKTRSANFFASVFTISPAPNEKSLNCVAGNEGP